MKRKNGEGTWTKVTKIIKGKKYVYDRYTAPDGTETYGKNQKEVREKLAKKKDEVSHLVPKRLRNYLVPTLFLG